MTATELEAYFIKLAKAINPNYHVRVTVKVAEDEPISDKKVIEAIERISGYSIDHLRTASRHSTLAHWRFCAYFYLYNHAKVPYTEIGKILDRDHSTVIYGLRQYTQRLNLCEPEFMDMERKMQKAIGKK